MPRPSSLSRRDFLKWSAASLASVATLALRWPERLAAAAAEGPQLPFAALPNRMQSILAKVPSLNLDQQGRLVLLDVDHTRLGTAPLLRTQWNLERSTSFERLDTALPWGIVIHWFGDLPEHDLTIAGYLRGFDGLRPTGNTNSRTSAHFLVGAARPAPFARMEARSFGILQTQLPDVDGTPFAASHLVGLTGHRLAGDSYFAAAFSRLARAGSGAEGLLTSSAAQSSTDWNYQTLAIEVTGSYFDRPDQWPGEQQIANLVGLVAALMRRYHIQAVDVLGHAELDPDKSDPGKIFIAMLRALIGAYALVTPDPLLKTLTFGPWLGKSASPMDAALAWFTFIHNYLAIVARPDQVYAWETLSGNGLLLRTLQNLPPPADQALLYPLGQAGQLSGDLFLIPGHHEGVDIYPENIAAGESLPVRLAAAGECLFTGSVPGYCPGAATIFRHMQPDGAQFLSVYAHLAQSSELALGSTYPAGAPIGSILRPSSSRSAYLHFALAFGASWEVELSTQPTPLVSTTRQHLLTRYLDPLPFLSQPLPSASAFPAPPSPHPRSDRVIPE